MPIIVERTDERVLIMNFITDKTMKQLGPNLLKLLYFSFVEVYTSSWRKYGTNNIVTYVQTSGLLRGPVNMSLIDNAQLRRDFTEESINNTGS